MVVLFASVLAIRSLLFGVCIRALDFWKLPYPEEPQNGIRLETPGLGCGLRFKPPGFVSVAPGLTLI